MKYLGLMLDGRWWLQEHFRQFAPRLVGVLAEHGQTQRNVVTSVRGGNSEHGLLRRTSVVEVPDRPTFVATKEGDAQPDRLRMLWGRAPPLCRIALP